MKRRPKAIAIQYTHPFALAARSAKNAARAAVAFMYGTPERTQMTLWFAFGLASLGVLMAKAAQAAAVCPV